MHTFSELCYVTPCWLEMFSVCCLSSLEGRLRMSFCLSVLHWFMIGQNCWPRDGSGACAQHRCRLRALGALQRTLLVITPPPSRGADPWGDTLLRLPLSSTLSTTALGDFEYPWDGQTSMFLCSRPGWIKSWAIRSSKRCPCPWQWWLGLDDLQGPFQPLTFCDSVSWMWFRSCLGLNS